MISSQYFLLMWLLMMVVFTSVSISNLDWQNDKGGNFKLAYNCEFNGSDITSISSINNEYDCGSKCYDNPVCTHFTWRANTCYLKHFENQPTAIDFDKFECGWISSRFSSVFSVKSAGWKDGIEDGVKWAKTCKFYGPDESIVQTMYNRPEDLCRGDCVAMHSCTNFNWKDGKCDLKHFDYPVPAYNYDGLTCGFVTRSTINATVYSFDFQDGDNGKVKWASGCDFYGYDIAKIPGPGETCGLNCANNPSCTHFTWVGNYCYLKSFTNSPVESGLNGAVCGWKTSNKVPSSGVQLSVKNNCAFTTWLATAPNSNRAPLPGGTIILTQGQTYTYNIPNGGWAGRFWPKTGCDGSGTNCEFGDSSPPCPVGGCQPPADTKVEFLFPPQPPKLDSWYDISLVDGYSLPMKIVPRGVNSGNCVQTTCSMSLNSCPTNEVQGLGDLRVFKNGKVVACLSPCKKWNYPAPYGFGKNEQSPGVNMCCSTPQISPQQCSTGLVITTQYVKLIHAACPSAYIYAFDDHAGLHNCPGSTSFDVTICP